MEAKTVFISYSWDSDQHEEWVLKLANQLVSDGINVIFDKFHLKPGRNLHFFVENSIKQSDKVIVILTPTYKYKAENRVGGVGHEYSLINNELLKTIATNDKVIPLLRTGNKETSIPDFLQQFIYADFTKARNYFKRYQELLAIVDKNTKSSEALILKNSSHELKGNKIHKVRILDSKITIDLLNTEGSLAKYTKVMQLVSLKSGLNSYKEDFGVDGAVEEISFIPGVIHSRTEFDGRITYEVMLEKVFEKGDNFNLKLEALLSDAFKLEEEHWTIISKYICDNLSLEVVFPKERPCKSFVGNVVDAHEQVPYHHSPFFLNEDKTIVRWNIKEPELNKSYRILWSW